MAAVWLLFRDRRMNEFIVHFFIMQNAGYKRFGFSTILHCLKDLCKIKKNRAFAKTKKNTYIGQCIQSHLLCHQPISWCGFLAATENALKRPKALKYGILQILKYCPNENQIWNTFFTVPVFFIDPWTWQILCHQPISCPNFSAATEDVLKLTLGLDIRGTTIKKSKVLSR